MKPKPRRKDVFTRFYRWYDRVHPYNLTLVGGTHTRGEMRAAYAAGWNAHARAKAAA